MLKKQNLKNILKENEVLDNIDQSLPNSTPNLTHVSTKIYKIPNDDINLLNIDKVPSSELAQNDQPGILDKLKSSYDSGINTITKWYQQSVEPGFDDVQKFITQDGRDLIGKIIPGVARSPYEKIRDEFNNYLDNPLKYVHENPGKTALGVGIPGALLAGAGALALRRRQRNVK